LVYFKIQNEKKIKGINNIPKNKKVPPFQIKSCCIIIGKYFNIINWRNKLKNVVNPVNFGLIISDCKTQHTGEKLMEKRYTENIIQVIQNKYN